WLWTDDGFVSCDSVPFTDRGVRYGMSLFESIRVQNRHALFLAEHLDRLRAACRQCGFPVAEAALENCGQLLSEDGFARIYVTAGDGSVTSTAECCRVFVFTEPRDPISAHVYHRGYDLGIAPEPHHTLFGGLKTANYWSNLDAFQHGVARQKNETLLFNHAGNLISACMANVFLVTNEKIQTPALNSGTRNGVVREWLLKTREVNECYLTRNDLEAADEIFLTSSWLGVMPAASLEGRELKRNVTARELHREYALITNT